MNDIWIHEKMHGGYSAVKVFENDDFYISIGGLNGHSHAQQFEDSRIILFAFKNFDLTLVGGGEEIVEYRKLGNQNQISNYVHRLLLNNLDVRWFKYLLEDAYNRGIKVGRNDIRSRMNSLLTEEF